MAVNYAQVIDVLYEQERAVGVRVQDRLQVKSAMFMRKKLLMPQDHGLIR